MKPKYFISFLLPAFIAFFAVAVHCDAQTITPYAGGIGDGLSATTYGRLLNPYWVAVDHSGNVFMSQTTNYDSYREISSSGIITNDFGIAGLTFVFDKYGNLYEAAGNKVIRKDTAGNIMTIAGTGTAGFSGDGSLATNAQLSLSSARVDEGGLAIDDIGNIYIADVHNNRIRKVDTSGIINTIAGGGTLLGDGGPAVSALLSSPSAVAADRAGNIYVADIQRIRKVNTSGIISTVAGNGLCCGFTGIGGPATDAHIDPNDVLTDTSGNVYFSADGNILKINSSGILENVAGGGGSLGDGGPAVSASLNAIGFTIDSFGNIFTTDQTNQRIRKINSSGIISTVAGNGIPYTGMAGDGGQALLAEFSGVGGMSLDRFGNVYMVDNGGYIRKISPSGIVSTIAWNGITGFYGDGGPATAAELDNPVNVATDYAGNVYIADAGTNHVRKINTSGIITTIAGGGAGGLGDGGPATAAVVSVGWVAADSAGNVYIADAVHNRVRIVYAATGIIQTFAGTGTSGTTGNGGPATAAELAGIGAVTLDKRGNVYISTSGGIRKVNSSGIISAVSAISGFGGVIASDPVGNLYMPTSSHTVVRVDTFGYATTVAGNGSRGYSGDFGPATAAEFLGPNTVAIDGAGHLFIGDNYNSCCEPDYYSDIREVCCMTEVVDYPPFFTRGNTALLTICENAAAANIDSLLPITDLDAGQSLTWTIATAPGHGSLGGFPATSVTTGGVVTPGGLTYQPAPGFVGTDYFVVAVSDGIDQNTIGVTVTVNPLPNAGTISGAAAVCTGTTASLYDGVSGGTWSGAGASATVSTSGAVAGVTTGTAIISYSVTNGCGTAVALHAMTVHISPPPVPGRVVCQGASLVGALTSASYSDVSGTVSGAWTTTSLFVSIDTTTVTGVSPGVGSVTYTLTDGCSAVGSVTVNPAPNAGNISGPSSLCAGLTATMTDGAGGGIWSSTSRASITSGGVVTAITSGLDSISYSVTNGCGTATATHTLEVNPQPNAGAITGASSVCASSLIILSDASPGGTWSSINPRVSVGATTGVVVGIAPGTAIVYYTVNNVCGTATDSATISVVTSPWAGSISGFTTLCAGDSTHLTDTVPGGAWISGDPFVASISSSGELHGMSIGATFVSYTVSNACGNAVALAIVNVEAFTPIDPVTGAATVCTGAAVPLNDGTPGGAWTSGDTAVATVSSMGIVTGVTPGVAAISYTVNGGCGVSVATLLMTIEASPVAGALSGPPAMCEGAAAAFTTTGSGGSWAAVNGHATMSPIGEAAAVTAGVDTFYYTVTNSCGTATSSKTVSIYPAPVTGVITGSSSACAGTALPLADTASGGAWSSSNTAVAAIGTSGLVNGVAGGTSVISYLVTTGCGAAAATKTITINAADAGVISGVTTLCAGQNTTLADPEPGGAWYSSATGVVTVGSATGAVSAVAPGSAFIYYTVTSLCGTATASIAFMVADLPVVSPISGPPALCIGSSGVLTDATIGGEWVSSNSAVASVGTTGVVSAVSAGTALISYVLTAGCGVAGVTHPVTVQAYPNAGSIVGVNTECQGSTVTLTDAAGGGLWSSSGAAVAVAGSTGACTGVAAGTALISYEVSNVCGTAATAFAVSVNPLPGPGVITGGPTVCQGLLASFLESVPGGSWSSGNLLVASVGTTGLVSGIAPGVTTISYAVSNMCGTAAAVATITVDPLPEAGTIAGDSAICAGDSAVMTDSAPGGTWSSSNIGVAAINGLGVLTATERGAVTIYYNVVNSCGAAQAHRTIEVNAPFAGTITGVTGACPGASSALTDSAGAGYWVSTVPAVAAVGSATGVVNALATGNSLIYYVAPGICGADTATALFTVGTLPVVPPITGDTAVCRSHTATVADGLTGGSWSSSNPSIAAIGSTGIVTGIAAGTAVISYMVAGGCGYAAAVTAFHVDTALVAGAVSGSALVCKGTTDTLADGVPGGVWSSSDGAIAVVNSEGVLTATDTGRLVIAYAITNSCGSSSATFSAAVIAKPYAGVISGNTNICVANTTLLTDDAGNGNGVWNSENLAVASVSAAGAVTGIAPGVTAISYALTNQCGTGYASAPVTIYSLPSAGVIYGPDTVCVNARFALSESVAGGAWTSGNSSVATVDSQSGQVIATTPGIAVISYSAPLNAGGCGSDTTFTLHVAASNPFALNGTVSPVNCFGNNNGSIALTPGKDNYQYVWSNGDSAATVTALAPGLYTVSVKDMLTLCTATDSFTVAAPDSLSLTAAIKSDSCQAGNGSIIVTVSGGVAPYSLLWSGNETGSEITGLKTGSYSLLITDKNQCQKTYVFAVDEVTCQASGIVVHDVITPNGDGINDYWVIDGLQKYPNASVQVFDKDGDLVYSKNDYNNEWNGQANNGNNLPDGTYFYVLKLNAPGAGGEAGVYKGAILIKR